MIRLHSFSDEFLKVAESVRVKPKKKLSGEVTVDRDHFVDTLERAEQTPKRGPHPALNYEHSWSKQAHPALSLEQSIFKTAKSNEPAGREGGVGLRGAAIGAAGVSPFAGMIGQKKLIHDPQYNKNIHKFQDMAALGERAEPGDIIVASKPKSTWKTFQSPLSGSEYYHADPVVSKPTGGAPGTLHQGRTISIGDAYHEKEYQKHSRKKILKKLRDVEDSMMQERYSDAVLLRPKKKMTPKQLKIFQQQAVDRTRQEYGSGRAAKSWLKDLFIPKLPGMQRLSKAHEVEYRTVNTKKGPRKVPVVCEGDVCSTLPAAAYEKATGRQVIRGKGAGGVLPADLLRSDEFESVGAVGKNIYKKRRFQPILTRAGIGAGLAGGTAVATKDPAVLGGAAGAYAGGRLAKHIVDRPFAKRVAKLERKKGQIAEVKLKKLEKAREKAFPTVKDFLEKRQLPKKEAIQVARRFAKVNLPGKILGGVGGYLAARGVGKLLSGKKSRKRKAKITLPAAPPSRMSSLRTPLSPSPASIG